MITWANIKICFVIISSEPKNTASEPASINNSAVQTVFTSVSAANVESIKVTKADEGVTAADGTSENSVVSSVEEIRTGNDASSSTVSVAIKEVANNEGDAGVGSSAATSVVTTKKKKKGSYADF